MAAKDQEYSNSSLIFEIQKKLSNDTPQQPGHIKTVNQDDDVIHKINTINDHDLNIPLPHTPTNLDKEGVELTEINRNDDYKYNKIHNNNNQQKGRSSIIATLISWLLLIYCVICCTYLLYKTTESRSETCDCSLNDLVDESQLTSINGVDDSGFCNIIDFCVHLSTNNPPTNITTTNPTNTPSKHPTINPSSNPSLNPSYTSVTNKPSISPTIEPTIEPTLNPTISPTYFDGYFIGDYKFSLKHSDHGFWKLCDGEYLANNGSHYQLFMEIGYQFGQFVNAFNQSYFKLPNVTDAVVGIAGNKHPIGDILIGEETMSLTESEMPSHWHYVAHASTDCDGTGSGSYLSTNGVNCNKNPPPNAWPSQTKGSGQSFSLMQPTKFISNLFIYTGVYV